MNNGKSHPTPSEAPTTKNLESRFDLIIINESVKQWKFYFFQWSFISLLVDGMKPISAHTSGQKETYNKKNANSETTRGLTEVIATTKSTCDC